MAVDPATAASIGSTIGKAVGIFGGLFGGGNPAHQTSLVNVGFDGRFQSGGGKLGNSAGTSLARAITAEFKRFGDALGIKPVGSDKAGITVRVLGNPNAGDRSGQSRFTVFAGPKLSRVNTDDINEAVQRGAVQNLKRNDGTAIFGAAIPKPARAAIKSSNATTIAQLVADVQKALKPPPKKSKNARAPVAKKAAGATVNPAKQVVATNAQIAKALSTNPLRAAIPNAQNVILDKQVERSTDFTPLLIAAAAWYFGGL